MYMYIETSSNIHGNNVFVSFERTDIIRSMGRFRCQLLLEDNTWSSRYNIPENDRCSDSSTDCTNLSLCFTVENYGFILICDEIDTAHADMCYSNIVITHSVY